MCLMTVEAMAYDFSAVCSTGQTLYYNIIGSDSVEVTHQNTTTPFNTTCPTGALTIPSTVTNGSKTYKVTGIGSYAFSTCVGLTSVTIPGSVSKIKDYRFSGCTNLKSITVESANAHYKSVDGVLYNKRGDTLICCPEGRTGDFTIPDGVTTLYSRAFSSCQLTHVTIPEGVTALGLYAFSTCNKLESVTVPSSVTLLSAYTFYVCRSLKSVVILSRVTSIAGQMFNGCSALTCIDIPGSVTSIGDYAFEDCTGLKYIVCHATTPPTLASNAFLNVPTTIPVYLCGSATVDKYKAATSWSSFSNLIAADAPTVKLASSNSTACDNANFELPVASINYITKVNTDSTWQYAVNGGAYDTLKTTAFSLSQFGGKTLTIKCAASNVCGTVADSMMLKVGHLHQVFIDSVSQGSFCAGDTVLLKVTKGLDRFSGTRIKTGSCIDAAGQKYAGRYVVAGDTDTYLTSQTYDMADSTVKSGDTTYYALRSAEQLAWFSYYVNHSKDNKAANARLMADIDLSSECGSTLGNWIPIASEDSGYVWNAGWTGTFDGNHHAISNLYINSDKFYQGLFGYAGGNIRQLQVTANISGNGTYHAAIAGYLCQGGRISYCTSLGSIKGWGIIGGISGENDGTIDHCVNAADIHAASGVAGGITGYAYGGITYCSNEGTITAEGSLIGGIAGDVEGRATLTHSCNRGKVTGKGYCGGIVGQLWYGTVSDCYSTDSVRSLGSYDSYSSSAGAIAGHIQTTTNVHVVTNCHYRSSIGLQENGVAVALKGIGNGTSYESNCYAHTDSVFATGVVARWLNGGNGTAEASGSVWGQTIGSDRYPVFRNDKNGVYQLTLINGDTTNKKYLNRGKVSLPAPTKLHYVFTGWTNKNGVQFTTGSLLTSDTTLYANYKKQCQVFIDSVSQGYFSAGDTVLLKVTKGLDRFSGTRIKSEICIDAAGQEYAGMYVVAGDTDTYLTSQTYDMADSTVKSGDTTYYALRSAEQLAWFSYYVNHSKDNKAANARLMADIDLSSECGSTLGNWIPIASKDSGYAYNAGWTGTFDGNHHAIRHLYINSDKFEQGLFGYAGGNIRQLQVTADISGNGYYHAAIAGYLCSGGRISYCTSHGSIKGWSYISGISGNNDGTIDHCVNGADIHAAYDDAGGISGRAFGGITYCSNEGTITAEGSMIGGIAGDVEGGATLTHSYNRGKVTGKGYCGGIVGQLWSGMVSDCYSTDSVKSLGSSDPDSSSAGAIAGYISENNPTLANCHYRSSIGLLQNGVAVALKGIGSGTSYESNCYAHTDSVFATGVVARWLNGGNGTAEASGSVWGQTLGSDKYPVFKNEKNVVYQLTLINDDTTKRYVNSGKLNLPAVAQTGDVVKGWYDAANNEFTNSSVLTSDTTLYATHKWWKYSITLVDILNKDTLIMVVTEGMKSYTLPTPTKQYYTFMGWSNRNGKAFDAKGTLTSDTTLYARWTHNSCTVTYININDTTTATYLAGNVCDSLTTPSKPNSHAIQFGGWNTKDGKKFDCSDLSSDTTLYANWFMNYNLTLVYNDKSVSLPTSLFMFETKFKTIDFEDILEVQLNDFTLLNYHITGWYTKDSIRVDTLKMTSDTTLYAQLEAVKYHISYISDADTIDTTYVPLDLLRNGLLRPVKAGYAFAGWNNKNGATITSGDVESDTTLYASWVKGHTLTLVTGLAGADYEPIADSVAAHPIAMSHYSFSYLADKTDEDKLRTYTLTGWYNSDSVRVDTLHLSSDTALYAHYTNTMVNITYIDTTNGRSDTVRISYALSDLYNQSVYFYQPAYKKNGTVAKWKTEGGGFVDIDEIYQDTTLYLAWKKGYVVTFVCNGKRLTNTSGNEMEGSATSVFTAPMLAELFGDETLLSATIEGWYNEDGERIDTIHIYSDTTYIIRLINCKVNAIYTAGVSRDIPSSTGVLLAGKLTNWRSYVDDSLYSRYLGWYEQGTRRAVDSRYTVAGNDTVYISWARKVTFVPGNGKAAYSVKMADDTTSVLPVPTAADSVFVGWTNSKGVAVGATLPAFALTSDTMLYAQWKKVIPTTVPENVAENCVVYAAEGAIHIVGSDAEAMVFNVKSQSVYRGRDRVIVVRPGIYLVKVEGRCHKVIVR
jgi:uncharacterized repeat protein (TIGR02543 family)